MASKSAFALLLLLSCASNFILQIRGKHPSQHGDNEYYKWKGGFLPGQRFSNSSGNSSVLNTGTPSQTYSHFASYSFSGTDSELHGVRAKLTLWKIADVQPMSSSSAYIAAHNFGENGGETIIAGVHVDPGLYKNYDLRFFTYWNSGRKGCFNVNCPGFVVADGANLYPGQALTPLSTYGGPERYITIRIKKDEDTGDWSLYREDQGGRIGGMTLLGWWPKNLFTGLSSHATIVEWTGSVIHPETERSPSMGSGHFSSELNSKAASFKQIFAFNIHGGVYFEPNEFASYSFSGTDSELHGVRAKVTLWKIADVQPMSSSSAYIAAHNFGENGGETIIAGVHVDPGLYKNYDLRFFTYWNSGRKGCFNGNCPGFVVADGANLYPGQALTPLSTYGGPERYITIRIKKDEDTGDWSLYREDQGGRIGGMTLLGWWPKNLFTGFSSHATIVEWTGSVIHPETERSPSMGSGHFSSELNSKVASFKQIFAFNIHGGVYFEPNEVTPFMDRDDCYTVSSLYYSEHSDGSHFFYGGPGGCSEK